MKKLILLLWVLVGCKSVHQQTKVSGGSGDQQRTLVGYKNLESYKGDTTAYLYQNFVKQKRKYVNQPLDKILKQLEIPILKYTFTPNGQDLSTSPGIMLKIYDERRLFHMEKTKENPNILLITWSKPLPIEEAREVLAKSFANWDKNAQQYYSTKMVGNVQITGYTD
jgi:hypothetical protein